MFFAKVDTTVPTNFKHPVDFLVPGVLSLAVMAAAMVSLGIATGFERRYGVLKRLGSTPLSRGGLLAAKTVTVLVFEVVEAVLVVVTGVALGWHVPHGLLAALALLLVGTVAFAGIGLLMARTLRAEANLAAANELLLVLLFLGGMAYPLAKLPGLMQAVAKALPAAALSDTVRSVLSTQAFPTGRAARRCWSHGPCRRWLRHAGFAGKNKTRTGSDRSDVDAAQEVVDRGLQGMLAGLAVDPAAHDAVRVDEHGLGDAENAVTVRHRTARTLDEGREGDAKLTHEVGVARQVLIVHADHATHDDGVT